MTLDKDVVNFIHKQNFIELSTEIIKFTENVRLTVSFLCHYASFIRILFQCAINFYF